MKLLIHSQTSTVPPLPHTHYKGYDYLSMLALKLNHFVSKWGPRHLKYNHPSFIMLYDSENRDHNLRRSTGFLTSLCLLILALHWRRNDHYDVSNHQPYGCLLNRLFRRRSKKTSKLHVTGLFVGNSPGPVNSPHKGPVTRKMFPFDDVIMAVHYKQTNLLPRTL